MKRESVLRYVKELGRSVFTTRDVHAVSGKSPSSVVQGLNHLCAQGALVKVRRGVWAEPSIGPMSAFRTIPYLGGGQRTYLSFVSALHLHGMIEQIPQVITCASLAHTRTVKTSLGVFSIHRMAPNFFFGFDWYERSGDFLVAEPEKALLDCLYLSGRKGKQFAHFPELHFPRSFSFARARRWTKAIGETKLRRFVQRKLDRLRASPEA